MLIYKISTIKAYLHLTANSVLTTLIDQYIADQAYCWDKHLLRQLLYVMLRTLFSKSIAVQQFRLGRLIHRNKNISPRSLVIELAQVSQDKSLLKVYLCTNLQRSDFYAVSCSHALISFPIA